MEVIQLVARWAQDQNGRKEDLGEETPDDKDSRKEKTEKDRILLTKAQAYAVIQLLERPYWSRLWIVQEISLSRKIDVWCGSMRVDFDAMATFLKSNPLYLPAGKNPDVAVRLLEHVNEAAEAMFHNHQINGDRSGTYSVVTSVAFFADNQCHDPRDKIYGLLGIIGGEHKITIDYSKSNLEVFVDVVNWWLMDKLEEPDDNRDDEGNLSSILDAGQSMGVIRRGKQRERITRWVEEHPDQPLSVGDMKELI
ncbi:uncharacterized protein LY89DRAFT_727064 [Mollisia scopiformis]|uniref:Heterokaryon incompatibility domain-containing protein n=1 Tax=Mollisia scopiformis TaxID=149040 RepID=A0A194XUL9_MOLSC|nr:uncharacterized protein LY89DRAFT_727064 [Mollisia scopiformis]KUJ24015.1 hypothetical protein LY89DRAFT_727064 [Mollisia scopiformis]